MPIIVTQKVGDKPFKQFLEFSRYSLRNARSSFDQQWRDLARFVSPRRARFDLNDKDRGERQWNSIINNIASQALRVATAGMFAGNASPARPWFALIHTDDRIMESAPAKLWLHAVERKILAVFRDSNFYNVLPIVLRDLLLFGTACMKQIDDFDNVARFYSYPIGSYYLGLDARLEVNQMVRELLMTADQIVERFGIENVSERVKNAHERGYYKQQFAVVQHIIPNYIINLNSPFAEGKPYIAVYYELGSAGGNAGLAFTASTNSSTLDDNFLGVEGFFEKPFYAPRWTVVGEDTYATECPAMIALGDVKQLQAQERRKGQAIDKMTNPPLQSPPTVRTDGINALPGGVTYLQTGAENGGRITTLYDVNLDLSALREDISHVEQRIKDAFLVTMFLAITEAQGIQPRNEYELITRNDEKLLQLGPVLQQVQGELLSPIVVRTFNQLERADDGGRNGVLPPIPEILRDQALEVRYISSLAQAQRATATQAIDRTLDFASRASQLRPDTIDKLNPDYMLEEYVRVTGAPPKILLSDEETEEIRATRAQQQQEELQRQEQLTGSQTAKNTADAGKAANEARK